ncbi:MAG: hypothetical protein U5L96_13770 [Owenweeksia sp.]|nr:hypothetical protein [Owenweeksia sp.]
MKPSEISQVRLIYPDTAQASFVLKVNGPEDYESHQPTGQRARPANANAARQYSSAAAKMRYEGAIIPSDPIYKRRDSLLASEPVFEMEVTDVNGEVINLQGYKIKGPATSFDPDLEAPQYDPDRLHGFINEEQMVLLQYYGLKHVLKPAAYFTP